jgi:hypothetical protein
MTEPTNEGRTSGWQVFWLGLAGSVVGGLLLIIFFPQPIAAAVSDATVSAIGFFYRGYVNQLYVNATLNPEANLIMLVLGLVFMVPIFEILSPHLAHWMTSRLRRIAAEGRGPSERSMLKILVLVVISLLSL